MPIPVPATLGGVVVVGQVGGGISSPGCVKVFFFALFAARRHRRRSGGTPAGKLGCIFLCVEFVDVLMGFRIWRRMDISMIGEAVRLHCL